MEGFSFSLDHLLNADLAQSSINIERLAVAVNKISLILNGKVANFNQVPEVDLNFSGDISIGDVLAALPADMAPQMRDIHASGWVKIEGKTRGLAQIDPPPQTKGRIELRDISVKSARLPQPFRLSRGEIGFTDHSLDIPWLQAKFGEIPLELRIRMEDFKALWVEGGLRMELDLGMVRELVPLPQGMAVSGRVKIAASVQGKAKQPEQMTLSGRVSWEEVEARTPALPVPAKLSGEADLVGTEVILSQMKVDMGGLPMSFSGKVSNLPQWLLAKGDLWATLRGEIDLGVIGEFGSLPPDNSISGRLVVDGEAKGRPEELTSMALSGEAELKDVTVVTPSLAKPVEKLEGSVALAGSDLILSGLSMRIGRSSLTIKGRLNDLLPLVLADSKGSVRPSLSFEVSSPLLNLDELLPEREKGGKKTINKRGVTSPPQIDMTGKVSLNRVIFQRIELTDFNANIEVKERAIRIEDARTQVYSGSLGGNVSLDLKDPETPAFSIDLRADRLQANDFLSTLTSFDDHLFGQLDMNASFEGRGAEAEAVKRSLRAQGTSAISGGRLENWDFLNRLASWLKLPQFKSLELRTLRNSFRVENQRLWLDDLSAQGKEADLLLSGSMGFDGSLDYRVMATLSPGLSNRFNAVGELSQYFKNDQGRVVLNFQVKGTGQSPRFTLDTSQAEQRMKDRLKKEADEKIEELKKKGKDLLKDLLGK